MKVEVPDRQYSGFLPAFTLAGDDNARVEDHPKYGYPPLGGINVFGGYGYNNVDTFQDTFNADVTAFTGMGAFRYCGAAH